MNDTIELTIPANARFRPVATLVLGGVGSRLELPYERIDDLQLAVLSALVAAAGEVVTMEVEANEKRLTVTVGPVVDGSGEDHALRLVLDRLVDSVEATARAGGEWLVLRLERASASAPDNAGAAGDSAD